MKIYAAAFEEALRKTESAQENGKTG